ncbi:unnamed protein product [Trifolium pratense]|uniref:Uncharacterized protein n=1 Tax=Trifolium pratense TaxID=57577 RepID=A0ACB0KCP3_TRIPR|nr:unnamed protein product [Trifolium pratense]
MEEITEVVEDSQMDLDHHRQQDQQKEEEDPLLNFVDQAKLKLLLLQFCSLNSPSMFYDLAGLPSGILKKVREVFLTGCYLQTTTEISGHPRLLPTEYLVILLDENQDDDAMLLGAQFCPDSFSSISLDGVNKGDSYSLYARIENIESAEI